MKTYTALRSHLPCAGWITYTIAVVVSANAASDNWPQWRGPYLNGTAEVTGLPVEWSDTKNVRWKTELPSWSGSTPIVWGDKVFVMSPDQADTAAAELTTSADRASAARGARGRSSGGMDPGGQALLLFCLSRDDGRVLWKREVDRGNQTHRKQNNTSPSPVTDGEHVWSFTGNGVLTCFDLAGIEQWTRRLQEDYGKFGLNWGYGSSPLLVDDRLIIPVLHGNNTDDPSYVLAINKATGRTLWRTERPTDAPRESPDAYVTPQLLRLPDRSEVILNGGDLVTGHDLENGRELWRADGRIYLMNESCETVVLEAGPEFKILALNKFEGSNGLSSPAVAGREIFLRTSDAIYCVAKLE
jgi:outer membrane protein assembly factor BamB